MEGILNNPLFWILLILLLILLLLYLLWARAHGRFPFPRYPRSEFYIQDQVIVTGPAARVTAVLSGLAGIAETPIRVLNIADLFEPGQACPPLPSDLVIALYQLTGLAPDVERAIAQIRGAQGVDADVIGEPNYLSGHPWDPEGSPWDPEGSPWDPEGSPWDPEGSPFDILLGLLGIHRKKKPALPAQPDWFMQQWAFRAIALDHTPPGQPYPLPFSGHGVRVGVFDTSPYFPALGEGQKADETSTLDQNPGGETLHVWHPLFYAHPAPSTRSVTDVRNHGYYVAGLIHALAPLSDLHLVRVLDAFNRGDTFSLAAAIFDFLAEARAAGKLHSTLINLSLGIRVPPAEAGFNLPIEVLSLKYVLQAARCLGVVILAAAGNDSANLPVPEPADLPAAWDTALGVAATNPHNQRSCFSNTGEIAAPGGDGRLLSAKTNRAQPASADGCTPHNADSAGPDSPWSVIGPVLEPPAGTTGYIFWSGTSFATPLVSGLAALVLECGHGSLSPQQVEDILKCGATRTPDPNLGAGVINVRATLACCEKQAARPQPGPESGS
jgi:subtilisin family serine protease